MSLFNEFMTERVTFSDLPPVTPSEGYDDSDLVPVREPVTVTEFVKNDIEYIVFASSHGFEGETDLDLSDLREDAERFLLQEGIPFVLREVSMV